MDPGSRLNPFILMNKRLADRMRCRKTKWRSIEGDIPSKTGAALAHEGMSPLLCLLRRAKLMQKQEINPRLLTGPIPGRYD